MRKVDNSKLDVVRIPARLIKDTRLSRNARFLWVVLYTYTNRGITPRTTELLQMTGVGRDALGKYLLELEQSGYLKVERVRSKTGLWSANRYVLFCPASTK